MNTHRISDTTNAPPLGKYKASLGTTAITITIIVSLLLVSVSAYLLYLTIPTNQTVLWIICIFTIVGIFILYLLTFLHRPVCYTVDSNHLIVQRPINDVKISVGEINDAFLVRKESMGWRDRLGGNGGLFGFSGEFKTQFGRTTWYATKLKNYIMIETVKNERIIITPDDAGMIKEIREVIGK